MRKHLAFFLLIFAPFLLFAQGTPSGIDIDSSTIVGDKSAQNSGLSSDGETATVGANYTRELASTASQASAYRNLSIQPTSGCTYSNACNYDPAATIDDGSCDFDSCLNLGCTYMLASNFNPLAVTDDGSCIIENLASDCINDINNDGIVNTADLNILLSAFDSSCD